MEIARRHASARDVAVDGVAHRRFEHFQFARQVHGNFGLPAVHRAEFHGDFEAVLRTLAAPVARHGFHSAVNMQKFRASGEQILEHQFW